MPLPYQEPLPWLLGQKGDDHQNRISRPINRVEETEIEKSPGGEERETGARAFDFSFNFRGTRGNDIIGNARLYLPVGHRDSPVPMIVSMHYEMDLEASSRFINRGWSVLTPHGNRNYNSSNLLGDGINHSIAMANLPRRFPFVDQLHVMLFGGSAGGYHALMAASRSFPLTAVCAGVPPLNLRYNIEMLRKNDKHNFDRKNPKQPPAPFMKVVIPLGMETWKAGRPDLQDWRPFSPVFKKNTLTYPTLITYSTADVLVPINQLSQELAITPPEGTWPDGFNFDMDYIVERDEERKEFLECLEESDYSLQIIKIPNDSPIITEKREELNSEQESCIHELPIKWSKEKIFSIVVLDEGYPEPFCAHTKYHHDIKDDAFFLHHMSKKTLEPNILNQWKLKQLQHRFCNEERNQPREYQDNESWSISRMDQPHLERWYVTRGLEIFIDNGKQNLDRLIQIYRRLPEDNRFLDRPDRPFETDPGGVLMDHQLDALRSCGDTEMADIVEEAGI